MSDDWREAARGIPVWEGARVLVARSGRVTFLGRVEFIDGDRIVCREPAGQVLLSASEDPVVPDLADPDVRAAYDRRLALALGAPPEAVDEGVVFFSSGDGWGWSIAAGADPEGDFLWTRSFMPETNGACDRLHARALAWPADKRVTR